MTPHLLSELAQGSPIRHWLLLGPFVVKTGPHFEREYMYERERILNIDYLAGDGGETSILPVPGRKHRNIGLGAQQLAWTPFEGDEIWGNRIAGEILYETVQRNCVFYAAARIDAEEDTLALFEARHSGMKAWVNGEEVCNEPYGLTKGIRLRMTPCLIRLHKGSNLLLVKFRPGYICDRLDFELCAATITPLASAPEFPAAIGRYEPLHFTGELEKPRQLIAATVINLTQAPIDLEVAFSCPSLHTHDDDVITCAPGVPTPVRLSLEIPRGKKNPHMAVKVKLSTGGHSLESSFSFSPGEPPDSDGKLFITTSFHFDTTYHEEQRVYAMGAFDIVRTYCRLHREDRLFRSIISEVDYLKPYADVYPEDRATLFEAFRDGRAEPDVMYNQPNEQTCGSEALVRNFLYGQLIHGRVFGRICYVYGPGDVFGHPNQLSQIARKSGCTGISWDKYIFNFPPIFDHLALDGFSLPHKRGEVKLEDVKDMGLTVAMGDAEQTPPTDWHAALTPERIQGTYGDFIDEVKRQCTEEGARLPVTSRDMSLYHAATSMSRSELKIANRLGENLLITAEKLGTIAAWLGAKYPEKALDKAWRQLLCGQHHDSITGTHNEISFVDLMIAYREVLELGAHIVNNAFAYLGDAIDLKDAHQPILVFNSQAWERSDIVNVRLWDIHAKSFALLDPAGKSVPFEAKFLERGKNDHIKRVEISFVARNMPSLGYRVYTLASSDKPLQELKTQEGHVIENEHFRIEVNPARGGGITRLYDKKAQREIIDAEKGHVGNELAILEEVADREETQHEFYTTGLKRFSNESHAKVEVVKGPISSQLRIHYEMGELCGVIQEITLYKGLPRIECRTILLDVQRENYLYCVTFPTTLQGAAPVFDERYGVVTRNASRNYLDFRTHRQIMFSDCAVYAANQWMEYGSCATLQAGRTQYALGMIGLITTSSPEDITASENLQRALIQKGVTCTPWLDTGGPYTGTYQQHMDDDLLYTRFRISLGKAGKNKYSASLLSRQSAEVRKAFQQNLNESGYAFLLVLEDRFAEPGWSPLPVLIIEAATAQQLNAACAALLNDFEKTAEIRLPAEVDATGSEATVDDYGVALLNLGTYANSIEPDGVICMMLNHTCRWYGGTNNFPEGYLIPENRNHVYCYALYPHAGDWRQAHTQQEAFAYNNPLLAQPLTVKKQRTGHLPLESSFLTVEPKNVLLTALKPFGNPIASFSAAQEDPLSNGIMARVYDTEGINAKARITFAPGMQEAWSANLLEERGGPIPVDGHAASLPVTPFAIETIGFLPVMPPTKGKSTVLGQEAEPVQPVWVRSWEHDAESMPMGYMPVVCSISRQVFEEKKGRVLRIRINVVNDYTDAHVSGHAEILVPEGWVADPSVIEYDLGPLDYQPHEVMIRRPEPNAPGQIKLRYTWDGQLFQDVLEIGQAFDLDMRVEKYPHESAWHIGLTNWSSETINAELAMATPIETWPSRLVGPFSLHEDFAYQYDATLNPGNEEKIKFAINPKPIWPAYDVPLSYWAVAKLMVNGRIHLKRCDMRPPNRRLDDDKWTARYNERIRTRGKKQ